MLIYTFPLIAVHDMTLWEGLRNGTLLSARFAGNTLGLVGMAVLFGLAVGYVSSGLLFFLPAVWGMFVVNNCQMVVDEVLSEPESGGDQTEP
jgi:hypothetical protein